jgi:uncharacterized Ntn-hydrolase superfamily protein
VTFSVVGRSDDGLSIGVAVASKFLAVGSAVPAARYGVGAIATQSYANTLYKRDGLALLDAGRSADETVEALLESDEGRATRQVGVVDAAGRAATWTGDGCHDWAGGVSGHGYAIQGNILTGGDVVNAMERAWLDGTERPLPERLLGALTAGDQAGGDRRGRQSAALLVVAESGGYTPGDDLAHDLRIDDHPDPVPELTRLLELHHVYFDPPDEAAMLPLEGEVANEVDALLSRVGHPDLESWAGVENYELRIRPERIDPFVLDRLREAADRAAPARRG